MQNLIEFLALRFLCVLSRPYAKGSLQRFDFCLNWAYLELRSEEKLKSENEEQVKNFQHRFLVHYSPWYHNQRHVNYKCNIRMRLKTYDRREFKTACNSSLSQLDHCFMKIIGSCMYFCLTKWEENSEENIIKMFFPLVTCHFLYVSPTESR